MKLSIRLTAAGGKKRGRGWGIGVWGTNGVDGATHIFFFFLASEKDWLRSPGGHNLSVVLMMGVFI